APTAPIALGGHDHWMGAGVRMVPALLGALPAIVTAHDAPSAAEAVHRGSLEGRGLFLQLLLRELAAHAAIVGNLARLLAAFYPFRHHRLDIGPGADRLDENALRFVVLGFCHVDCP